MSVLRPYRLGLSALRTVRGGRRLGAQVAVVAVVLGGAVAVSTAQPADAAPSTVPTGSGWSTVAGTLPAARNGHALNRGAIAPRAFRLDASTLTGALAGAPMERTKAAAKKLPVVSIPGADGKLHRFTYVNSPVMEPGLAAKVAFSSYAATSMDEPGVTARFDYSPALGFHAMVRGPKGAWSVDPAYKNDTSTYVAYRGVAVAQSKPEKAMADEVGRAASGITDVPTVPGAVVTQRIYRLALANDPGYAALVGAANVDVTKAAIVNRLDEIYGDDLAVKFVLADNNNKLDFNTQALYTGKNGPCGANACYTPTGTNDLSACSDTKIDQTAVAIPEVLGRDSFDVGQILDPGANGGVASLDSVGKDAIKASGCSGGGDGKSDFLAVEFLAHELGHQFGATHTFSSTSCGGFSTQTDTEIGSGSSIMSYAGTCAPADNIQQYSDPYFAHVSLEQMRAYITSTIPPADNGGQPAENGGFQKITTANHNPSITVPSTVTIPVRTPFTLAGTVTDVDGDVPGNVWEQNDAGTVRPLLSNAKSDGALFRTFGQASTPATYETQLDAPGENVPVASGNTRTLPDIAQIASGNTDAATGTCPTPVDAANPTQTEIECFAEFLPTTARTLHFSLTARDDSSQGGGVDDANTLVNVSGTAPFAETNTAGSVTAGSAYAVKWNVAGTTAAPFGVANVKISYSTDGGLTYPTVLAASVPNNGTASVTVPSTLTTTGRFKVQAIGQPCFDISHANLAVTPSPNTAPVISGTPTDGFVGSAYNFQFSVTGNPTPVETVSAGALPAGLSLSATGKLSGTPTTPGVFNFTVQAANSAGTVTKAVTVTITGTTAPAAPTNVTATGGDASATVTWTAPTDTGGSAITGYKVEYSSNNGTTFATFATSGTATTATVTGLTNGTSYVFRVSAINAIGTSVPSASSAAVTPSKPVQTSTTLQINAPADGTYGAHAAITATLTGTRETPVPLGGETVSLLRRASSTAPFARLKTVQTDSTGLATVLVPLTANAEYEWTYAGSDNDAASTSDVRAVAVNQSIAVHVTASKVKAGALIKIYGTVGPVGNGQLIYLQVQSGSSWKNVTDPQIRLQTLPDGTTTTGYLMGLRPAKGSAVYRVYKPGTGPVRYGISTQFGLTGT